MPFFFKRRVFEAVLTTKLLYGCESWLNEDYKAIEGLYMSALKSLLGVRKQTPNEIVLTECGMTEVKDLVRKCQKKFINKKLIDPEETLTKVYEICRENNTRGFRSIQGIREYACDSIERRKEKMMNSTKTKIRTYLNINPSLLIHKMYKGGMEYVPDFKRVEMTRFRAGSHRLKIETGRWCRTPQDQRLCDCELNVVQDEYFSANTPKNYVVDTEFVMIDH